MMFNIYKKLIVLCIFNGGKAVLGTLKEGGVTQV